MNFKKFSISFTLLIFFSIFLSACTSKTETNFINLDKKNNNMDNKSLADSIKPDSVKDTKDNSVSDLIVLKTKHGDIKIKLYTDKIPNFSKNFIDKANSKYYNGLTFHRVEPGFVAQGGDPLGNGTGGGNIPSEIDETPFVRGSVGVARGQDIKINNDSQFFICLTTEACSPLTGLYTNFGEVISGMEFVDQIAVGDKILEMKSL